MIRITLKCLSESISAFDEINKTKMDISLAYDLAVAQAKFRPELETFQKLMNDLASRYGTPDPNTSGLFLIPPQHVAEWSAEREKLESKEIDIELSKINLSRFGNIQVSPECMMKLSWLIGKDGNA